MDKGIRGIVIFAAIYFALFIALEGYIYNVSGHRSDFYASPIFASAVVLYIIVVALMLSKYKNRKNSSANSRVLEK